MSDAQEHRITELETLVAFHEQAIETLKAGLLEQDKVIAELNRRLEAAEDKLGAVKVSEMMDAADESPPPHY